MSAPVGRSRDRPSGLEVVSLIVGAEVGVEVEVDSGPKQARESDQRAKSVAATLPLPSGLRAVSRAGSLAVLVRRLVREHLAKVVLEAAVVLVRQQWREQ